MNCPSSKTKIRCKSQSTSEYRRLTAPDPDAAGSDFKTADDSVNGSLSNGAMETASVGRSASIKLIASSCTVLAFTAVAIYGWTWVVLNYLSFGFLDLRSAAAMVVGLIGLMMMGRTLASRFRPQMKPSDFWFGLLVHMILAWTIAVSILLWVGSALPESRYAVATVFGFGSVWLILPTYLRLLDPNDRRWSGVLLLCLGGLLLFAFSVRSFGLDGRARPIVGWAWKGKSAGIVARDTSKTTLDSTGESDNEPSSVAWPEYMGANRDSIALPMDLGKDRPVAELLQVLWEVPIGESWSSCAVEDGTIYTQQVNGESEELVALSLRDGKTKWSVSMGAAYRSDIGGDGARATPTIDGRIVYAVSGNGMLQAVDRSSGKTIWSRDVLKDASAKLMTHGVCGSPLVVGDRVYMFGGDTEDWAIVGYDKSSGEIAEHGGTQLVGYSSLVAVELCHQKMLLALGREELVAYSLGLDRVWFRYPFANTDGTTCSQPVVIDSQEGLLVLSAGYGAGSRCIQVQPSPEAEQSWTVSVRWTSRYLQTKFSSVVRFEDRLFGLDNGILQSVRWEDGKSLWKKGRYGYGQVLLCPPYLLTQCEEGALAIVDARQNEFTELLKVPQLTGKTWNHPVWSPPYLLLRNDNTLRCLRIE